MTNKTQMSTGTKLAVDFGPLLIFFLVNSYAPGSDVDQAVWATGAFMLATGLSMLVSKLKTGSISLMLWLTATVVLVFGGLTIVLHDEKFIQIKPTIIYSMFATILFYGMWKNRPVLRMVLEAGFPAMADEGWRKLTRNWAIFFVAMAALNEVARAALSFDAWVQFKVWGVTLLSFAFTFSQVPILMRHSIDSKEPPAPPVPPQG